MVSLCSSQAHTDGEKSTGKMRFLKKNLPALTMLAAGFACGVVVTLIFASGRNPTVLRPAASSLALGPRLDCSSQLSDCVCDKEADRLRRLARLAFLRSQVAVNVTHVRQTFPGLTKENISELKTFLYPSNPDVYPGIPLGVPKLLKEEYLIKEPMLIGILTQQEYLHTRAQGVYETWAQDITEGKVVFFVGEDCEISANLSHLSIIKLIGIPDNVYPPLKKAFAVMQYMYDHFINDYNWFIRADDDMYVRGELLTELLKKMSPYERVYLGRAGVGKDGDLDRLHLLPHERYCMGGPGVVFSNAAMRAVGPHLNDCLNAGQSQSPREQVAIMFILFFQYLTAVGEYYNYAVTMYFIPKFDLLCYKSRPKPSKITCLAVMACFI